MSDQSLLQRITGAFGVSSQPLAVPLLSGPRADATSEAAAFSNLDDPYLIPFLRGGATTSSGAVVNSRTALFNTATFRCVDLISTSMGMLPLHLHRKLDDGGSEKAEDHPLYDILHNTPNSWQTAFEFRSQMQAMVLIHDKGAFARIIWGVGPSANKVQAMIPLDPTRVTVVQSPLDWTVSYKYRRPDGTDTPIAGKDMFHLRGLTTDGLNSISRVQIAKEAIGLAQEGERAAGRLYTNGSLIGGVLKHKNVLSPEAHENLRKSMEDRHTGSANAHRWMILEEDMDAQPLSMTGREAQSLETRKHQIEEIARVFGVPRPLMMMDDTSWGSGIEQLGQGFVRYGLGGWFTAWEQAISRCLLAQSDRKRYYARFNPGALLRGSMKDQAEFFAKALGSGGSPAWMTQNEVRSMFEMNRHENGDELSSGATAPEPAKGEGEPSTEKTTVPKEGDDD